MLPCPVIGCTGAASVRVYQAGRRGTESRQVCRPCAELAVEAGFANLNPPRAAIAIVVARPAPPPPPPPPLEVPTMPTTKPARPGCKEAGCARKAATRGYCNPHYEQRRRAGEFKRTRSPGAPPPAVADVTAPADSPTSAAAAPLSELDQARAERDEQARQARVSQAAATACAAEVAALVAKRDACIADLDDQQRALRRVALEVGYQLDPGWDLDGLVGHLRAQLGPVDQLRDDLKATGDQQVARRAEIDELREALRYIAANVGYPLDPGWDLDGLRRLVLAVKKRADMLDCVQAAIADQVANQRPATLAELAKRAQRALDKLAAAIA